MKRKVTKKTAELRAAQDNPEWSRDDFARAVPFSALPEQLKRTLSGRTRGPQKTPRKVPVSIRLSPDVVAALRASGAGWQARVDEILRAHVK